MHACTGQPAASPAHVCAVEVEAEQVAIPPSLERSGDPDLLPSDPAVRTPGRGEGPITAPAVTPERATRSVFGRHRTATKSQITIHQPVAQRIPDLTGPAHSADNTRAAAHRSAIKQKALHLTTPASTPPGRYRPADPLLAFLESL